MISKTGLIPLVFFLSIGLSIAGCSSGQTDPVSTEGAGPESGSAASDGAGASGAPSAAPSPKSAPAQEGRGEQKSDETIDYTKPADAQTYCDVFGDFEKFNEEAKGQNQEKTAEQYGDRLSVLAGMMKRLAELGPNDEAKKKFGDAGKKYDNAYDFYMSSGKNIANDDVLYELAEALDAANTALSDQKDEIKDECGFDVGPYITNGK